MSNEPSLRQQALDRFHAGDYQAAAALGRQVLQRWPDDAEARYFLGLALAHQGHFAEAEGWYRAALAVRPDDAAMQYSLAATLRSQRRLAEAQALYEQCRQALGENFKIHLSLGGCLHGQAQYEQALAHYEQAIALQPTNADAHYYAALVRLALGDFERGWPEFRWRLETTQFADRRYQGPRWEGEPLAGRPILVYAEGGAGDTLQFVRYLPQIEARGGHVWLEVPKALVTLLQQSGYTPAYARGSRARPADCLLASLVSLPRIFQASLHNIPADVPYLQAGADKVRFWRERLQTFPGFKVGIHWEGSANAPLERRDIPLAQFERLARVPGVTLFSLQRQTPAEQNVVVDLGPLDGEGAFLDTAAIIKNLDLVITCDTSLAHLAGALAAPVWVALNYAPDWRWLTQRTDSPWYPTMRLFRQTVFDDWTGVFDELESALRLNAV